jgi:hypothetical protein
MYITRLCNNTIGKVLKKEPRRLYVEWEDGSVMWIRSSEVEIMPPNDYDRFIGRQDMRSHDVC